MDSVVGHTSLRWHGLLLVTMVLAVVMAERLMPASEPQFGGALTLLTMASAGICAMAFEAQKTIAFALWGLFATGLIVWGSLFQGPGPEGLRFLIAIFLGAILTACFTYRALREGARSSIV